MKKKLSVTKQIRLAYTWCGLVWVLMGITKPVEGLIASVLEAVATLICVTILAYIAKASKEEMDEMASINLRTAKARVLDIVHILYCIIAIATMLVIKKTTIEIEWSEVIPCVLFIMMGVKDLLIGFFFKKLEDE